MLNPHYYEHDDLIVCLVLRIRLRASEMKVVFHAFQLGRGLGYGCFLFPDLLAVWARPFWV